MFAGSHLKLALPLLLEVADSISQQWEAAGGYWQELRAYLSAFCALCLRRRVQAGGGA